MDKYDELIATPNRNKAEEDTLEARSVGEALSALNVGEDQEEDRHPERCVEYQSISSHVLPT